MKGKFSKALVDRAVRSTKALDPLQHFIAIITAATAIQWVIPEKVDEETPARLRRRAWRRRDRLELRPQ
jgi:hypothetical protein